MKNLKYRLLYLMLGIALVAFAAPALTSDLWTVDTEGWSIEMKNESLTPNPSPKGEGSGMKHEKYSSPLQANSHSSLPLPPPDSMSHTVKKTDYPHGDRPKDYPYDLSDPENLKPETGEYDEKTGMFRVGAKLGDNFLSAPWLMTPAEYMKWTERKELDAYFRERNDSLFVRKGKEKFDFTNMHFDLGPAEKIFGPGGVQIKSQGSAELKFGYNYKFTDNPSLSERNRKVTSFDFDEKINLSMNAKVGDKMDFNINYNTDATFDFDSKNLKLQYE
ncbi:MAG: cell surface protein SprA, partial [Bacteroidaceae bacterium]|nr:cell surface protein SprA [Bacteroidaceae bacterium]